MKKLYLLIFFGSLFFSFLINAQSVVIYNGEDIKPEWWPVGSADEAGNHWDNPNKDIVNGTDKTVSVWRDGNDDLWTGGGLGGLNIEVTSLKKFSLMVLKEVAGNVQVEVQGEGADNQYLRADYLEADVGEWQLLDFYLPQDHGFSMISTLLVAPHIDDTKEDLDFVAHRMYWDELTAIYDLPSALIESKIIPNIISSKLYTISGMHYKSFDGEPIMEGVPNGIYILVGTCSDGSVIKKKVLK